MLKEERQSEILAAAERMFKRYGPAKTSIADIAREAAMSPAHIYNFFASKDAVFEAVGARKIDGLKQKILAETRQVADPWDKITILFTVTAADLRMSLPSGTDVLAHALTMKNKRPGFLTDLHDFLLRQLGLHLNEGMVRAVFTQVTDATPAALFDCMALAVEPLQILQVRSSDHAARVAAQLAFVRRAL